MLPFKIPLRLSWTSVWKASLKIVGEILLYYTDLKLRKFYYASFILQIVIFRKTKFIAEID